MATAKRLYLYLVLAFSLSLWVFALVAILRLLLNKLGIGTNLGLDLTLDFADPDRDLLCLAIALGVVGFALWLTHWWVVEGGVRAWAGPAPAGGVPANVAASVAAAEAAAQAAAAERASIVRSAYFAFVLGISLLVPVALASQIVTRVISDVLDAGSSYLLAAIDDGWVVSLILVLSGIWAYHAWVRARDVRWGPFIGGAAAWFSRLYLYTIAFIGLTNLLVGIYSIVNVLFTEWAMPRGGDNFPIYSSGMSGSRPWYVLPLVAAVVQIVIWTIVWLSHWAWSNHLRTGKGEQSAAERVSRVRLAYLAAVVFYGAVMFVEFFWSGLAALFSDALVGSDYRYPGSFPLWYSVLTPMLGAVPFLLAWLSHRWLAMREESEVSWTVSARRVTSYTVALVGMVALTIGLASMVASIFGEWFVDRTGRDFFDGSFFPTWKYAVASYGSLALMGLAVWVWPWFAAQRRRDRWTVGRTAELASSARAWHLRIMTGLTILVGAAALADILYDLLRFVVDLSHETPNQELQSISQPLGMLLVVAVIYAVHWRVLRRDAKEPGEPLAAWQPRP
jgi:uncharacterized membrane protein